MSDMDLAAKCLEFFQVLAAQGQTNSLSITIGSSFSFNLDTRLKCSTTQASPGTRTTTKVGKKKPSPSTVKRNKKRKESFLEMKLTTSSTKPSLPPPKTPPTNQPLHNPPPSKSPPSNKTVYTSIPSLPDPPNTLPQSPPEKNNVFLCSACKKSFKTKLELVNPYNSSQTLSHIKLASFANYSSLDEID